MTITADEQRRRAVLAEAMGQERADLMRRLNEANRKITEQNAYIQVLDREARKNRGALAEGERAVRELERLQAKLAQVEEASRGAEERAERERLARIRAEDDGEALAARVPALASNLEALAGDLRKAAK